MAEEKPSVDSRPTEKRDNEQAVDVEQGTPENLVEFGADRSRDDVLRIRAEMENLRKRQARELENAHKYALDKIALELLPV